MFPREAHREAELGETIGFADQKAKPVGGTMHIFASPAMADQCLDGIRLSRGIAVDS